LLTGITRRSRRSAGLSSSEPSLSAAHHILMPVSTRKPPNTYRIQWNCDSSQPPTRIMMVRSTMAPMMPIISTRFWKAGGTAK
jgi:hypothetical protein